jgi:choline kinase
MAGIGSRMGNEIPKPLIEINGKPMIQAVIENLGLNNSDIYNPIFCINAQHSQRYKLDVFLASLCNNASIICVDKITEGPACTCLLAKEFINNNSPLIIINADQIILDFNFDIFNKFINIYNPDGILGVFLSNKTKNSYLRLNNDSEIIETKEKEVISHYATNGLHYWKHGKDFVSSVEDMIKDNARVNNEFYVAPTFNYLIKDNKKILPYFFNLHFPIGTKEDLEKYLNLQ